jgi:hypothetical protein
MTVIDELEIMRVKRVLVYFKVLLHHMKGGAKENDETMKCS